MRIVEAALCEPAVGPIHCALAARKASSARESQNKLENIAAQVLILGDLGKLFGHVGRIDLDVFLLQLRSFEGDFIEHALQDGMQAARADIFGLLVHHHRKARQPGNGIVAET